MELHIRITAAASALKGRKVWEVARGKVQYSLQGGPCPTPRPPVVGAQPSDRPWLPEGRKPRCEKKGVLAQICQNGGFYLACKG